VRAGAPFSLTVSALDAYGNVATGYLGTVHFGSTDGSAALPPDFTFGPGDGGVATFDGLALHALGSQRVTVTDERDQTIFGTWALTVLAG
jgi:hypothetical protein